jgi:2,3-diaminopropionyl alpha,beta-desaturase
MPLEREHELFRKSLRRFLEDRVTAHLDRWEADGLPYRDLFPALGSRGYLGITQPIEYGGLALDHRYTTVWAHELGRLPASSPAMSLSVQTDIVLPILEHAESEIKEVYLREAIAGRMVAAFAVTEASGGSDIRNIRTTATPTNEGFLVSGEKSWITNGSVGDFLVVVCRTADTGSPADLSLLVIPANLPGVTRRSVESKLGNWASDHGMVSLENVVVPRTNLIGVAGDGYALMTETLIRERRFLAVVACAQARRILTDSIVWANSHRIMGRALIDQQTVRLSIVDLLTQLELIEAYVDRWSTSMDASSLTLRTASVMKLRSTQVARQAADLALQLRGARAYMTDVGPARDVRDTRAGSLAGGSDEALLHLIAKHLDEDRQPGP